MINLRFMAILKVFICRLGVCVGVGGWVYPLQNDLIIIISLIMMMNGIT